MSVSAAISSANFEALEQAVTGKDNEVFSTILFDSYDDKRIEELLMQETAIIISEELNELIEEVSVYDGSYSTLVGRLNDLDDKNYKLYKSKFDAFQKEHELTTRKPKPLTDKTRMRIASLYNYMKDKKVDSLFGFRIVKYSYQNERIDDRGSTYSSEDVSYTYLVYKNHRLLQEYSYSGRDYNNHRSGRNISIITHLYNYDYVIKTEFKYKSQYRSSSYTYSNLEFAFERDFIEDACSDGINSSYPYNREFLLKRICERHAMNETLVQSMKKKFEIERLYYKMKDLYDEDVKLTRTINSKHEQLNSLQEDICAKKVELNQLDMRILQAQNDLEALAYHHKQMELATEINNEVTLLEDDKEALDAKRMHDYYINFANDLKVYKFAFEHMREISMKLEQERKDFEEYKAKETKELEDEVSIITYEIKKKREDFDEEIKKKQYEFEEEIKRKQEKFDEDCEAYEEESTKWKSMQESKFAKYQRQIDNYDYVVDERDRLEREVEKLNKELKSVTNERDRYRTTIETLSSFRK